MDPFVEAAVSVYPRIRDVVSDDVNDATTAKVIKAVKDTTGADTAEAAKAVLADPTQDSVATKLKFQLADIALDACAYLSSQSQLALGQQDLANTESARDMLVKLATTNESRWSTPALLSYAVVIGFILLVFAIVSGWAAGVHGHMDNGTWVAADPTLLQLANICIGALAASFATVLNFWLGSSLGSRRKDVPAIQASSVDQSLRASQRPAPQRTITTPSPPPQ